MVKQNTPRPTHIVRRRNLQTRFENWALLFVGFGDVGRECCRRKAQNSKRQSSIFIQGRVLARISQVFKREHSSTFLLRAD